MKNKILISILAFAVAWMAAGVWDCGCLFAASAEHVPQIVTQETEGPSCHEDPAARSGGEDAGHSCCPGCSMEGSASIPPQVEIIKPLEDSLYSPKGFADTVLSSSAGDIKTLRPEKSSGVPSHNVTGVPSCRLPLYTIVQSFLI